MLLNYCCTIEEAGKKLQTIKLTIAQLEDCNPETYGAAKACESQTTLNVKGEKQNIVFNQWKKRESSNVI